MVAEDQIDMNASERASSAATAALKREFSRRLHEALSVRDMSQAELHRRSNVAKDSISKFVRGQTLPADRSLRRIARVLGVKPESLMPWSGTDVPNFSRESDRDHGPTVEDVPGDPTKRRIRVNQVVTAKTAGIVYNLIVDDVDGE